jgi:hypothetical protein
VGRLPATLAKSWNPELRLALRALGVSNIGGGETVGTSVRLRAREKSVKILCDLMSRCPERVRPRVDRGHNGPGPDGGVRRWPSICC